MAVCRQWSQPEASVGDFLFERLEVRTWILHPGKKLPLESPKMKIFCSKWCSFSIVLSRWFLVASNVNFARVYRILSELYARGSSVGNKNDLPVLFWKWWPWNRGWFVDPACMAVFAKMQRWLSPGDRQQRHTSSRLFLVGNQILHFRDVNFFFKHIQNYIVKTKS